MVVRAVGMGAGSRDLDGAPNLVRVLVGEAAPEPGSERAPMGTDDAVVLSANVDDMDPRLWPGVLRALLAAGALDAWLVPILMKKGRPASTLHVLARPADVAGLGRVVVEHTTTLGVRVAPVSRLVLDREVRRVLVAGIEVAVKVALLDGRVVTVQPEYEDVAAAAEVLGRPERAVLAAAAAAADAGAWV
ncbi:MAG: nickel insertion protein [Candidatus Nanopelagicales bacterium]